MAIINAKIGEILSKSFKSQINTLKIPLNWVWILLFFVVLSTASGVFFLILTHFGIIIGTLIALLLCLPILVINSWYIISIKNIAIENKTTMLESLKESIYQIPRIIASGITTIALLILVTIPGSIFFIIGIILSKFVVISIILYTFGIILMIFGMIYICLGIGTYTAPILLLEKSFCFSAPINSLKHFKNKKAETILFFLILLTLVIILTVPQMIYSEMHPVVTTGLSAFEIYTVSMKNTLNVWYIILGFPAMLAGMFMMIVTFNLYQFQKKNEKLYEGNNNVVVTEQIEDKKITIKKTTKKTTKNKIKNSVKKKTIKKHKK
ncbi:MAG: hypothetical protein WC755_00485 [Candidatus Woesearchaeota archaeon]|jgi:hypothetical protein